MKNAKAIFGISAIIGSGLSYFMGKKIADDMLKSFLEKSVYIEIADDAPSLMKSVFATLKLSIKISDLYDSLMTKKSKKQQYFKITVK